ncbi:hypothetical protein AKA01nite_15860 [Alkalibacterium kapii]|uniref:Uncharacterized protein n=1 Tax=Alkalibacterium kapii TaxID=426704 RepID=A0A511AUY9_9LACT|nr:hypothetical protein AKA01nite_15860 [Alkalibacterium kapii]
MFSRNIWLRLEKTAALITNEQEQLIKTEKAVRIPYVKVHELLCAIICSDIDASIHVFLKASRHQRLFSRFKGGSQVTIFG